MADLDQGGSGNLSLNTVLGPSLGPTKTLLRPQIKILTAGTFNITTGMSVILVNVAGAVTLNLPSVSAWVNETAGLPATGFERAIWVKDWGGNAGSFPISIVPAGTDQIDLQSVTLMLSVSRTAQRLYPVFDLTGWYTG